VLHQYVEPVSKRNFYNPFIISKKAEGAMNQQVAHPMEKFQRQVRSLIQSKVIKPTDRLWKIALLYGDDWGYWKKELEDFEFTMQDSISDLLDVETWEDSEC
jgi:hypothetical protein